MTGDLPPTRPPTARSYTEAGLPWFDYYGADVAAVAGAVKFKKLVSIAKAAEHKGSPVPDNETIGILQDIKLGNGGPRQVREGPLAE